MTKNDINDKILDDIKIFDEIVSYKKNKSFNIMTFFQNLRIDKIGKQLLKLDLLIKSMLTTTKKLKMVLLISVTIVAILLFFLHLLL